MTTLRAQQLLLPRLIPHKLATRERCASHDVTTASCQQVPLPLRSARQLSTSAPRAAGAKGRSPFGRSPLATKKLAPQGSIAINKKKAQEQAMSTPDAMLEQFGILPYTFVSPPSSERISWTEDFWQRYQWQKALAKSRLQSLALMAYMKFYVLRTRPPEALHNLSRLARIRYALFEWVPVHRWRAVTHARSAYNSFNAALARGDREWLARNCMPGLAQRLVAQVAARQPAAQGMGWRLERHVAEPRLASYGVAMLDPERPAHRQHVLFQAVVEFDSMQTLSRPGESPTEKRVREYLVLHRWMLNGETGPWRVWGTTSPTTLADVQRMERLRLGYE